MIAEEVFWNNRKVTLKDQDWCLSNSHTAYKFALLNIPGTDLKKCQEAACKTPYYAFVFAMDVIGADLHYCRMACSSNKHFINEFDKMIAEKVLA